MPWIKALLYYVLRKSEKVRQEKQRKKQECTALGNMLIGSGVLIFGTIPYIGAYYYADLKSLWLVLGATYFLTGAIMLIMVAFTYFAVKHYSDELTNYENKTEKETKDIIHWPKWQENALCLFQYTVLAFWLYSWRLLIA